ncbi:CheY-like chemotaxis protein [Sagittula marina]|uniref:CheY-like chemotaxis protein n=1 Tax=Sagittula marina TaxID=943940 RepID=A0A7W6DWF1_9RHOB|nr:response regulator [Sagittula marina]MBB3987388.1 CheY-like chemotaxis protein [Sagittula marina]
MTFETPKVNTGTVLVLDDEALIAMDLAATVEDCGLNVLGPAFSMQQAFELIEGSTPELALLDINIGKEQVWPLARELRDRGVGLVFISGDLSPANLQAEFHDAPRLHKPALPQQVCEALDSYEVKTPTAAE